MIITDDSRTPFRKMFGWCRDSMIQSYFEGICGSGFAECETDPEWAAVRSGDFLFCSGEPVNISDLSDYIRTEMDENVLIIPEDRDKWLSAMQSCGLPFSVITRYHTRTPEDGFSTERLRQLTENLCGCLRLVKAGAEEYTLLRDCEWENSFVPHFKDAEDFLENGFAFCLYAGDELASAASTFGHYSGGYELQIATAPKFRRRGYAEIVGAAFVLECLRRGKTPHWDAAHTGSLRLAGRIGFIPDGEYPALTLQA